MVSDFLIPVRIKSSDDNFVEIKDALRSGKKIKSITVRMEATHSGKVNGNNFYYTPVGMAHGVKSFFGAPVTIEHDENSPIIGRVLDSKYVDYKIQKIESFKDTKDSKYLTSYVKKIRDHVSNYRRMVGYKGLGHIELICKITDSDAIQKVLDGEYIGVSVGGKVDSALCSVCGTNRGQRDCGHSPGVRYDGEKAFLIGGNMTFDHVTYTKIPADKNAASSIIRDSEDVSSEIMILDFEIEQKGDSMKVNISEVSGSNQALADYAGSIGLKDFVISDAELPAADYLFSEEKTFPISDKLQASLVMGFIQDKVQEGEGLDKIIAVVQDKLKELEVEDYEKVLKEAVEAQEPDQDEGKDKNDEGKIADSATPSFTKEELVSEIVDKLRTVLTVQDDFSSSRIRALTAENKSLRDQISTLKISLKDSIVDQICSLEKISDSAKIESLKQRTIVSLQDKLQDLQAATTTVKAEDNKKDEQKETVLEEGSVTLDHIADTKVQDSQSEGEAEEKGEEAETKEFKVLDSKTFEVQYKAKVKEGGFQAGRDFIEECRKAGTLPEKFK